MSQDFELRKTIRAAGGKYRVVKNNLAEIASEGTASEQVLKGLRGMTSMAYTTNDPQCVGQRPDVAHTRQDTTRAFTFKAGVVEGKASHRREADRRSGEYAGEGNRFSPSVAKIDQCSGAALWQ